MLLPDEDENLIFAPPYLRSSRLSFLFSSSSSLHDSSSSSFAQEETSSSLQELPTAEDLLGLSDVDDDDETYAAILDSLQRLETHLSISSSSSSSFPRSSSSSSSSSVAFGRQHVFCVPELRRDGLRVLFLLSFEFEEEEENTLGRRVSLILSSLSDSLARCPACVVQYLSLSRLLLLALRRRELQSFTSLGARGRERNHLTASSVYEGRRTQDNKHESEATRDEDEEEDQQRGGEGEEGGCKRLQRQLLAWDLLRIVRSLRELKEDEEEEEENNEGDKFKKRKDVADGKKEGTSFRGEGGENGGGLFANREGHSRDEMAGEDEGDEEKKKERETTKRKKRGLSAVAAEAAAAAAAGDAATLMKTRRISTSSLTCGVNKRENDDGGGRDDSFEFPCNKFECIDSWMSPLLSFRSRVMNQVLARLSSTLRNESSFSLTTGESSLEEEFILDRMLRASCVLLEILLDSGRLLCPHFSFPLGDLTDDLRAVSSSLPSFLLSILTYTTQRFISSRKRLARFLAESLKRRTERVRIKPPSLLERYLSFLSSDDEQRPREDIKRRSNISDTVEGRQQIGERSNQQEHPGWLLASMKGMRLFSTGRRGENKEVFIKKEENSIQGHDGRKEKETVADKNETREDILSTLQHHQWSSHEISLESHQHLYDSLEGLQNFLRCHKELFNTIVSHLHHHTSFSSSSLSFSLDMNQLPPSFPSALSVPPPVFILPLLPSPLFFLHAVFFSLLLFPLEVAPVLLSLQTHSFPTIRLIACAALHLATIRRHHLSRHQHSHPSFSSSSSSLSNPVLSKCPADAKCTAVHDPRCGYSPLSSHTEEISASPSSLSQASRVSQTPLGQKEEKGIKGTSPSSTARSPVSLGSTCSSCSTSSCVISLVKGSCPSIASPSSLLFPFSTDVTSRMGMVVKQWMTLLRILSMSLSRGYERYQEVLVKRSEEDSEVEVIRVEGELPGGKKKNEEMKTIHDNDAYDSIVSDLGGTLEHLSLILRALHSLFIVVLPPQSTLSGHASQGGALVLSQSFVDEERFRSMKVMTSRESEENFSSSSSVGLSVTMKSAVSEFDHVVLHEKEDLGESSLSLSATSNQEENRSSLDSTFPRLKRKWMTSSGTDSKRANKKGSTLVKPLTNRCGVCTPSIPGLASVGALLEEGIAGTASACVISFRSILNHMRSHQRDQSDGSNFASFCTRRGKQDETASSSFSPLEKKDSCLSEVRVKTEKDKDPLPQVHNRCDGPSSTLPPEQKDYSRPSLACKTINSSSSVVDDRSVNDRDDEHGQEEEKSVLSFFENEEVKSLTKSEEMFIVGCHPAFLPLSSKSSLNTGKDNCEERESVYFLLGSPPSATKTTCHTSSLSSSSSSSPASSSSLLSLKVLLNSLEDVLRGLLSIWQMELSRRREQGSLVSTPASLCYRDGTDFSRTKKNEDKHASFMRDEGDSKGTILSSQHTKKEPSLLVTGKECEREEEKADVCRNKRDALARDIKKKEEGHAGVKEKNLKTEANVLEEDLLNSISRHDEDECRKIVFARTLCSSYEKDRSLFEICVLQNLLYTLALLGKLFASSISRPSSSFCSNSSLHLLSTGKEPPEGENDGRQAQKSSAHNGHAMPYTEDQKESRKEERRLESLLDEGSLYRWRNLFHGVHTEAEGRRKELRSKYSHRPSQCDSSSLHANSRDGKQSPLVISSKESNSVGTALKERGGVESNEEKRLSCREERAREIKTEEETFSSSTYTSHQIEDTSLLRGTCWCCAKISVMLDDLLNFLVQQEADIKLHRGSSTSSREKAEEEFCEQLNEKKKRCEGIHSQEKGESKGAEDEQGDRRQLTKYGDPLNDSSSSSLVDQTDISVGRERCLLQGEKEQKVLSSEEVEVVMERLPHRQKITVPKANEEDKRLSVYENLSAGGKAQSHFHTPLQEKEQQEKIGEKVKIGEEVKIEEETKVEEEEQEKIEGEEVPRKETKTSAGKDEGAAISSVGVDDFLLRSSPSSTSCGQQEVVEVVVEADSSGIEKGIASDVSMDEDKKSRGKSTVSGGEDPSEIELKGGVEEEEEEDFLTRRLREEILQNSPWYKAQDFRDANKSISTTHWSRSHGDVRDVSFLMNKSPPGERGVDDEDGEERELIHIKDQIEKNKKEEEEEQQQEVILIEDDDDETIPSLKRGGRPDVNEEEDVEEDEWKERDMHNDEETDLEDFALPPSTAREVSFTMKQTGGKENPDAVRRNDSFISCDQDERENDEDQQATVNERGGTVSLPSSIHRSGGLEEQAPQTSVGGDRLKGHDEAKEEEGRETLREEEKNGSQPDVTPRRTSLSPQERRNVGGVSSLPPVQGEDLEIVLSDDYSSEEEMRRLACLARASQESKKNSPSKKDKKGRGEDDDDDMWGSDLDDLLATQFTQEVETRRFAGGGRRRRLHKPRDEGHTEDDEEGKGEEEEDDDLRFFKGRSFPPSSSSLSPRRPEFLEKKTMTVTGASPSSSSLHIEETDEPEFLTVDTDEELRILEVSRGRKKRRRGSRKTPLTREQREQEVRDFFQQMAGEGEDDDGERFLTHRPVDKAWRKEREKTTTSTMRSVSPSSDVSSISSPSDVDPISAYSSCVSSPSRTSSLEDLKRMGKQRIIPPHDTISGTAGTRSLHKTNVSSSSLTNILFPESFSSTGPGVGSKKKSIQESERGIEELWETAAQAESLQQKETKKRKIREDLHLAQERQAETLKRSHEQTSLQSSSSSLSPSAGAAGGKQRVFIPAGCFGTTSLGGSKAFGAGYEKLARKEATDAARKMLMMNMTGGVFPANEEGQQHPSLYHSKEETEKFKASSSSTQSRNTMQNIFPSSSSLCTTEDPICTSSPNDCLSSSASPPFSVHNDRKASRSTSISPPPVSSSLPASSSSPPPSLHVLSRSTSVQQVRAAAAAEKIDLRRRAQQMLSACLSGLAKEGERKLTTSGKSSGAVGNLHGGIQSPPLLPSDGTAPRQPISLGHQRGLSGLLLQEQHHDPHHQHFQQKSREDPYANLTGYRFTSSRKKKPFLLKGSLGKVAQKIGYDGSLVRKALPSDRHRRVLSADYSDSSSRGMKTNEHQDASSHFADSRSLMGEGMRHQQQHHQGQERGEEKEGREKDKSNDQGQKDMSEQIWKELEQEAKRQEQVRKMMKAQQQQRHQEEKGLSKSRGNLSSSSSTGGVGVVAIGGVRVLSAKNPIPPLMKGSSSSSRQIDAKPSTTHVTTTGPAGVGGVTSSTGTGEGEVLKTTTTTTTASCNSSDMGGVPKGVGTNGKGLLLTGGGGAVRRCVQLKDPMRKHPLPAFVAEKKREEDEEREARQQRLLEKEEEEKKKRKKREQEEEQLLEQTRKLRERAQIRSQAEAGVDQFLWRLLHVDVYALARGEEGDGSASSFHSNNKSFQRPELSTAPPNLPTSSSSTKSSGSATAPSNHSSRSFCSKQLAEDRHLNLQDNKTGGEGRKHEERAEPSSKKSPRTEREVLSIREDRGVSSSSSKGGKEGGGEEEGVEKKGRGAGEQEKQETNCERKGQQHQPQLQQQLSPQGADHRQGPKGKEGAHPSSSPTRRNQKSVALYGKYSLDTITLRVRAQQRLPVRYQSLDEFKMLVAPLLFLEILHQLRQAFREQTADPRLCVLERMQPQSDQWFSGLFSVSSSMLNNWRRLPNSFNGGQGYAGRSNPFSLPGSGDLDAVDDVSFSSSSSRAALSTNDVYFPSSSGFSLYELVVLVPVRYTSPHTSPSLTPRPVDECSEAHLSDQSALAKIGNLSSSSSLVTATGMMNPGESLLIQKTNLERQPLSRGASGETDAETVIRMIGGRTFSAIAKIPMESSFLLGLVEKVEEAHGSHRIGVGRTSSSNRGGGVASCSSPSGSPQFVVRFPVLVTADLNHSASLARHRMRRAQVDQVCENTHWVVFSLTQLLTSVRELQAVFLSQLSPRFSFVLDPLSSISSAPSSSSPDAPGRNRQCLQNKHSHSNAVAAGRGPSSSHPAAASCRPGDQTTGTVLSSVEDRSAGVSLKEGGSAVPSSVSPQTGQSPGSSSISKGRGGGGATAASRAAAALAAAWVQQAVDTQMRKKLLDTSQGAAVRDVLTRESKVGLIQGPPGTGKTQTLIAMLSIIYTRLREQQQQRTLQQQQMHQTRGGVAGGPKDVFSSPGFSRGLKRKILVCAPSNAAVDEIAERLILHGLQHPMTGEVFRPTCIRIGNPDRIRESVQCISLDCQVKRLREAHDQQLDQAFQAGLQELRQRKRVAHQQLLAIRLILSHRFPKGKCAGPGGATGSGSMPSSFSGCLASSAGHTSLQDTSAAGDVSRGSKELQIEEILKQLDSPAYVNTHTTEEDRDSVKEYLSSFTGVATFTLRDLRQTLEFQLTEINAKLDSIFDHRRLDKASLLPACRYQALLTCDIIFTTLSSSATDILCPYALSETVGLGVASSGLGCSGGAGGGMMLGLGGGKDKSLMTPGAMTLNSLPTHPSRNYLRTPHGGSYVSAPPFSYAYLIVDEAGQASEISCLIPFRLAPDRCILVGDPQQLPSTVFSALAESRGLGRSLLERLMLCAEEMMATHHRRKESGEGKWTGTIEAATQSSSSSASGTIGSDAQKEKQTVIEHQKDSSDHRATAGVEGRDEKEKEGCVIGAGERVQDPGKHHPSSLLGKEEKNHAKNSSCRDGTALTTTSAGHLVVTGTEKPDEHKMRSEIRGGVSIALTKTSGDADPSLRINVLTTQYRMRDEIVRFPSEAFYQGRLKTSASVFHREPLPCFRLHWLFAPLKFFHVPSCEDRWQSASLRNFEEARFVVRLLRSLHLYFGHKVVSPKPQSGVSSSSPPLPLSGDSFPEILKIPTTGVQGTPPQSSGKALPSSPSPPLPASGQKLSDVGVITPYRQQVSLIQQMIADDPVLSRAPHQPEINTVDAFQGREKSIVIISFVRATPAIARGDEGDGGGDTCGASDRKREGDDEKPTATERKSLELTKDKGVTSDTCRGSSADAGSKRGEEKRRETVVRRADSEKVGVDEWIRREEQRNVSGRERKTEGDKEGKDRRTEKEDDEEKKAEGELLQRSEGCSLTASGFSGKVTKKRSRHIPSIVWDLRKESNSSSSSCSSSASSSSSSSSVCVSASTSSSAGFSTLGFVADLRRLNVALTRARDALWVVGDGETLQTHTAFRRLISHVRHLGNDAYIDILHPPSSLRKLASSKRPEEKDVVGQSSAWRQCDRTRFARRWDQKTRELGDFEGRRDPLDAFFEAAEEDFKRKKCSDTRVMPHHGQPGERTSPQSKSHDPIVHGEKREGGGEEGGMRKEPANLMQGEREKAGERLKNSPGGATGKKQRVFRPPPAFSPTRRTREGEDRRSGDVRR